MSPAQASYVARARYDNPSWEAREHASAHDTVIVEFGQHIGPTHRWSVGGLVRLGVDGRVMESAQR